MLNTGDQPHGLYAHAKNNNNDDDDDNKHNNNKQQQQTEQDGNGEGRYKSDRRVKLNAATQHAGRERRSGAGRSGRPHARKEPDAMIKSNAAAV